VRSLRTAVLGYSDRLLAEVIDQSGQINEDSVVIEEKDKLYVFGPDHPRPANVVDGSVEELPWNW